MPLRLFVDFDGTITRGDVGNIFFRTFGGAVCDDLVRRYREGEIGARECFLGEASAMGKVDVRALDELIDAQQVDPSFGDLAALCRARGVEILIVSDGLDYYIRKILTRSGNGGVPFVSNVATLVSDGEDGKARISLGFPHADAGCDRCACCKRNIVLNASAEDDIIAYVGDGYSDRCPARYADIVFAKDDLQTYCRNENISYTSYRSLGDVVAEIRRILDRPLPRARRRAETERRAAFRHES